MDQRPQKIMDAKNLIFRRHHLKFEGFHQIVNHGRDVLIRLRRLLIQQFFVFADDVAAEFGAGKILG